MNPNGLKDMVRTVPDWPKPGILFRDLTTLFKNPQGFAKMMGVFLERYQQSDMTLDVVAGIESRGFIVGSSLAYGLKKGFVPIRKEGKLPAPTFSQNYHLEYGEGTLEIHKDAIGKREKVLLVDDLLATGGTVLAAIDLIKRCGGSVTESCFVANLPALGGSEKLRAAKIPYHCLMEFEGE